MNPWSVIRSLRSVETRVEDLEAGGGSGGIPVWSAGTYELDDVVEHNDRIWQATATTTQTPSDAATEWVELSELPAHVHVVGDITGLQTALDGKADDAHTHVVGDVTGLQAALDGKADDADITALDSRVDTLEAAAVVAPNAQSAAYTLVLSDANKAVGVTTAGAAALTVPPNSDVAFPIGTVIEVAQMGAGTLTITAGAGVTLRSRGSLLALAGQYAVASIRKRATDEWVVAGDLA